MSPPRHTIHNTVIVIVHNLDVIKSAGHLIDLGPEGGSPATTESSPPPPLKDITSNPCSFTGQHLHPVLNQEALAAD